MLCIFLPDIHIKENSKFPSTRTVGTTELTNGSRKKATDKTLHTQDIHSNTAPGLGTSFLSRFRDEEGEENTDFPKAPGSCPGLTPRLRCRLAGPFPCSGTPFSLAAVGSRWATPEPDALSILRPPTCPPSPSEPAGASAGVRDCRGRSVTRPACGGSRRSRPSAAAPTAARTRVPSVLPAMAATADAGLTSPAPSVSPRAPPRQLGLLLIHPAGSDSAAAFVTSPPGGWEGAVSQADAASVRQVPVPLRGSEVLAGGLSWEGALPC